MNRLELTRKYGPKGMGLEIAGLHNPWPVIDPFTRVIQMDLFDNKTLVNQYPEMGHKEFTQVHILDDGNYCKSIPDESMDFLFSSHVLEHLINPIEGIRNWIRVLKKGSIAYLAVPLRDQTFDRNRENTTWEHVLAEFDHPLQIYRNSHYREYFSKVDKLEGKVLEQRIKECVEQKSHIHFHCWDFVALQSFFINTKYILKSFDILEFIPSGHEALIILRKT